MSAEAGKRRATNRRPKSTVAAGMSAAGAGVATRHRDVSDYEGRPRPSARPPWEIEADTRRGPVLAQVLDLCWPLESDDGPRRAGFKLRDADGLLQGLVRKFDTERLVEAGVGDEAGGRVVLSSALAGGGWVLPVHIPGQRMPYSIIPEVGNLAGRVAAVDALEDRAFGGARVASPRADVVPLYVPVTGFDAGVLWNIGIAAVPLQTLCDFHPDCVGPLARAFDLRPGASPLHLPGAEARSAGETGPAASAELRDGGAPDDCSPAPRLVIVPWSPASPGRPVSDAFETLADELERFWGVAELSLRNVLVCDADEVLLSRLSWHLKHRDQEGFETTLRHALAGPWVSWEAFRGKT